MKAKEIDYDLMNEWFYYDETSPSCLRWKKASRSNKVEIGSASGTLKQKQQGRYMRKHWEVSLKGEVYMVHRVVYVLHHKLINNEFPVDHIDHDSTNNKIGNLRNVSHSVNMRNMRIFVTNSTGVTGVSLRGERYSALWREDERLDSKSFSVNKYGEEEAFRLACQAREEAIKRLNEQGAGYTEAHGSVALEDKTTTH